MTGKHKLNPAHYSPELLPHFDPLGVHPHDIPAAGIFDEPRVHTCINAGWLSHITGMIERLTYLDAWRGTEAEQYAAIDSIVKIIAEFDKGENMNCCCTNAQRITRFAPDGSMEISTDDGVTWNPVAGADDPRNLIPLSPPIDNIGQDIKCEMARSATQLMKDAQARASNELQFGANANAFVVALLAILAFFEIVSVGTLTPLILTLAAALLESGKVAFDLAFDDNVWSIVQCAIYCNTDPSGAEYTSAQLGAIRKKIGTSLFGIAQIFIDTQLKVWGTRLLTNAARAGFHTSQDCSACDCACKADWDFTVAPANSLLLRHDGSWEAGKGWKATFISNNRAYAVVTIPVNCPPSYFRFYLHENDVPFDHAGYGYRYVDNLTGVVTTVPVANNLGCAASGDCGGTSLHVGTGDITILELTFQTDTKIQNSGLSWLRKIRHNTVDVFP